MITEIEDYFRLGCGRCERFTTPACSTRHWADGLGRLRALCLEAGLEETVKWGHPSYMFSGRNIAVIGALKSDFRLSFFHAALLKDADGILERQGPNTRHPDMIRFVSNARVGELAPQITAYLKEAMAYAAAGTKPPKERHELDLPEELAEALGADPALGAAYAALTPGRQRSYVIALSSAKTSATRAARILKLRDKVFAGKGANER